MSCVSAEGLHRKQTTVFTLPIATISTGRKKRAASAAAQQSWQGVDVDSDDANSLQGSDEGGRSATSSKVARAGKANKKRDQRSDLVEIWMTKNDTREDPKPETKKRYAEVSCPINFLVS